MRRRDFLTFAGGLGAAWLALFLRVSRAEDAGKQNKPAAPKTETPASKTRPVRGPRNEPTTATRLVRRTRIAGAGWDAKLPEAPVEVVGAISPTPLLIVHGDADHYFPVPHFQALAAAAPDADHWLEPGMGHAETATTPELLERIADWVAAAVRQPRPGVCDDGSRE